MTRPKYRWHYPSGVWLLTNPRDVDAYTPRMLGSVYWSRVDTVVDKPKSGAMRPSEFYKWITAGVNRALDDAGLLGPPDNMRW